MRLGIAHHFGWAVAVTASADHKVVDRRRIEMIEPGMPAAPIHHEGKPLDDAAHRGAGGAGASVGVRATSAALDQLAAALREPMVSMSLRAWPLDFPKEIAVQRRAPYEARADSVMYRQVLAERARARGWEVHLYDAKDVEARAVSKLAERADEVLHGPRATLGPPWAKDHRMALAATIVPVNGSAELPAPGDTPHFARGRSRGGHRAVGGTDGKPTRPRALVVAQPDAAELLADDPDAAAAAVAVTGASRKLSRVLETHPDAVSILAALDRRPSVTGATVEELIRWKDLEELRIAARDLLGLDPSR